MKHICHISTTFNHQAGSARRTYAIARQLADSGYQVSLIVGRDFNPDPRWDFEKIRLLQEPNLIKYVSLEKDFQSLVRLTRLLRVIRPDLVHTHQSKAGILGRLAARIAKVPLIVHTVHGPAFADSMGTLKRTGYLLLERLASKVSDHFVFVGRDLADFYIRNKAASADRSSIIYTGRFSLNSRENFVSGRESETLRAAICKNPNSFVMLTVGRIVPSKQQEHSILALASLRSRGIDAELVIAGEALLPEEQYYKARLMQQASKLGISEYVHFPGFVDNVLALMAACDVMTLTSKYEGLPNVVVEAALADCPLISYEIMGVAEVISQGLKATLVPLNDTGSLIAALVDFASNPPKKRGSIQDNRYLLERFSVESMLSSKLELYKKLLGT